MRTHLRKAAQYGLVVLPVILILGMMLVNPHGSGGGHAFVVGLVLVWPFVALAAMGDSGAIWFGVVTILALYLWSFFLVLLCRIIYAQIRSKP
jgi:hypothetical protein